MMKTVVSIFLMLFVTHAFATTNAIAVGDTNGFEALSLRDGVWGSEGKQELPQTGYKTVYYSATTHEAVAFSFHENDNGDTVFAAACKSDESATWQDCSPVEGQVPAGNYQSNSVFAHDGHGAFMLVGSGAKKSLIAACRDASGQWSDCSPSIDTQSFNAGAVGYGNGVWMVLSDDMPDWNGQYNITKGFCMSGSRDWAACDAIVEDRNELSMLTFQAIEYLPAEQRWVAVGMAHEENKDVFKSYCRMTSETRWTDCTGGMFLSNGTSRLVKNSEGHLLQLNNIAEVTYNPVMLISHRTQALCRELMGTWKECGAGLSDLDMKFFFFMGASVTDNGEWILAGCQFPDDYGLGMPVSNAAHLTAVLTGSTWQVNKQIPDNTEACIMDIYRQ